MTLKLFCGFKLFVNFIKKVVKFEKKKKVLYFDTKKVRKKLHNFEFLYFTILYV